MTKDIDWEAIEREYRAGQLSIAHIAREFGISRPAIDKRAKKHGWTRNLAQVVRNEIESKLVAGGVATCNTREAIDTAVSRGVDVVLRHRRDISKLDTLRDKLADKAKFLIETVTDLKELGDAVQAIESLGRTQAKLIPLERQAFNLNEKGDIAADGSIQVTVIDYGKATPSS